MFIRLFLICGAVLLAATHALAQSGYRINAGDKLTIEVLEDPSLNRQVLVLPDGSISFPMIGGIRAGRKSPDQFQRDLANALAPNFASSPTVFVSVTALAQRAPSSANRSLISVYAIGEVKNSGLLQVEKGTTLLQSLAQIGGFTRFAATKRIQLRRIDPQTGGYVSFRFNYRAVEGGATIPGRTVLTDGDVIVVPQRRLFE